MVLSGDLAINDGYVYLLSAVDTCNLKHNPDYDGIIDANDTLLFAK